MELVTGPWSAAPFVAGRRITQCCQVVLPSGPHLSPADSNCHRCPGHALRTLHSSSDPLPTFRGCQESHGALTPPGEEPRRDDGQVPSPNLDRPPRSAKPSQAGARRGSPNGIGRRTQGRRPVGAHALESSSSRASFPSSAAASPVRHPGSGPSCAFSCVGHHSTQMP